MGLGCGGPSRLGLKIGGSEAEAERVVREALSLGVNFIDTAESYETEEVVGRAIRGIARDRVVLSTKEGVGWKNRRCTATEMKDRVEASLRRLAVDAVDILHLHGVSRDEYNYARRELVPALLDLREQGKVRYIGITEAFGGDTGHAMLSEAVRDDCWDVMMVGFNLLNQSARDRVLAATREQGVGTLCMFAVRRALAVPDNLRTVMAHLAERALVDADGFDPEDPLGFLLENETAASLPDAAYRFCRWEPGLDIILSGTSSIEHLRENAASLARPPLPPAKVERLRQMFARVDCIAGN